VIFSAAAKGKPLTQTQRCHALGILIFLGTYRSIETDTRRMHSTIRLITLDRRQYVTPRCTQNSQISGLTTFCATDTRQHAINSYPFSITLQD